MTGGGKRGFRLMLVLLIILLLAGSALLIWGLHDYARRVHLPGHHQTAVVYCVPDRQVL